MLGTKLLLLSVLAYASGQGVSYYGSSSVRTQSRLPPRPLSYRPDYAGQSPVYNPQPVYQAPTQLPEQLMPEHQALRESQPPLRPRQLYGPLIPHPPVYDPQAESSTPEPKTESPEIPPQPIYSPIPPHSALPLQPSPRPLSPRPLPAWSWKPTNPAVVIIEENPITSSHILYPSASPSYASKSVEPSIESSSQSSVFEQLTSTLEPEEEAVSTLSVLESSSVEYHEQSDPITEPSEQKPLPELDIKVPQTSWTSSDLIDSQEPLTDTIPKPSSEKPQPAVESVYVASPQRPSDIQNEISPYQSYSYPGPRPLPARPSTSPVPVISLEPQSIEPVIIAEPKPIDPVPSVPSYQPIELQKPVSEPIQTPSKPNYQPPPPSSPPQLMPLPQTSAPAVKPNYYQPSVPAPELVHIPLSYQPIAPAPVVQPQPPLTPRPYPIQPSQRPVYQPPVTSIEQPLPLDQPVLKPIKPQIPQQQLPVVQPAPIPEPISQPQIPQYPSRPVVPEALPILPMDDFHCNAGNAYYRVVNECDSYITCKNEWSWKHTCPDGLHFNPNALYPEYPCSYPSEVKCEVTASKQIAQPTSECPNRYGFFPLSGGDCSRYVMCQEGKATVMNCPIGLVFNNQLSSCDWPENVPQCSLSAFKDFSCPIPPEDDPDFLTRHRYGNECGMYVACQRGHPRLLKCDLGLSFDEESQVCIDTDLVEKCRQREARYN